MVHESRTARRWCPLGNLSARNTVHLDGIRCHLHHGNLGESVDEPLRVLSCLAMAQRNAALTKQKSKSVCTAHSSATSASSNLINQRIFLFPGRHKMLFSRVELYSPRTCPPNMFSVYLHRLGQLNDQQTTRKKRACKCCGRIKTFSHSACQLMILLVSEQ